MRACCVREPHVAIGRHRSSPGGAVSRTSATSHATLSSASLGIVDTSTMYGSLLGDEIYVAGVVAKTVERAEVELSEGRVVPVEVIEAPEDLLLQARTAFERYRFRRPARGLAQPG